MNAKLFRAVLALASISVGFAGNALAQYQQNRPDQSRHGFWFSAGLGYGSLGCQNCSGRTGGLSGNIAFGGTLSPKLLLGVSSNGWVKSENGTTLTVNAITAAARFYPSARGGFFLLGGLGLGTVSASITGAGSGSETGWGALLGLGYDIPLSHSFRLTPYWNGFAMNSSNVDANVGQIGLGITVQ
jgi:hypothetical protein